MEPTDRGLPLPPKRPGPPWDADGAIVANVPGTEGPGRRRGPGTVPGTAGTMEFA